MELARQSTLQWDTEKFDPAPYLKPDSPAPCYISALGALFDDDCLSVLPFVADESVDAVFADPPFNLGKEYGRRSIDARPNSEYLDRGMHFTPDYPTSCGWPVRLPRRCWTISE